MPEQRLSERSIFEAAIEMTSAQERAAYLERACGNDAELRRDVEALLDAHQRLADLSPPGSDSLGDTVDEPISERPDAAIGPYQLLEQIGEGGFGLVFLAEQAEPIRRKVALKVLKPGMDTRQVIARFEAERQALALMDHPNIARVLDAGATPEGRPYFVMDLVRGRPITEHCDQHRLGLRQRLGLFVSVCRAVQHAHQKGVIHRDIKPSNVLVEMHEGAPVARVIDFGIAKSLGRQLTDRTLCTSFAQVVGTPLYMSPEQADMGSLDVDTRSDIYSLGVLLYELLTGATPFDRERLRRVGLDEMRRIIREEEPPRPSTRAALLGPEVAGKRQSEPGRLSRLLRGELDWIVMRALEKDRNRRYESAGAFAADVERYLSDQPVMACPPSAAYRLGKFARRNKTGLGIAGLILFFLVILGGSAGWFVRDRTARRDKAGAEAEAALGQIEMFLAEADREADDPARLQAVVRLAEKAVERAEGLLATSGGTEELAGRVREARAAVDAAAVDGRVSAQLDRIDIGLKQAIESRSRRSEEERMRAEYAALLRDYGVDPAVPEEAAARVRGSRVRRALLTALDEWRRATTTAAEERRRLEQVLDLADPAPDAFRTRWRAARRQGDGAALARLAQDPAVRDLLPTELGQLGQDLQAAGQLPAAAQLLREACRRHPGSFWLSFKLAAILLELNPPQAREAIVYYQAALAARGPDPFLYLNLALALHLAGDVDEAIRHCQAALDIDPNLAWAHNQLGIVLWAKGDREGATRAFQTALRIEPDYAPAHSNLGFHYYYLTRGDVDGAIREYEAALRINPEETAAHNNLGLALQRKHDLDGAIRHFEAALRIDPEYADAHYNLGIALKARGDLDGAIRHYRRAAQINPRDADFHNNLGNALGEKGDREGAIREYQAAIKSNAKHRRAHYSLGTALLEKGDLKGAIRALRTAVRIDPRYAPAHFHLGLTLERKGDLDGAIPAFKSCLEIDPGSAEAHHNLGNALKRKGDPEGPIREYQAALAISPNNPAGHCALGLLYMEQGRFAEALRSLQTGHRLGSLHKGWPYPSAEWGRQATTCIELEARLPKVLRGEAQPRDADDAVVLAQLSQEKKKLYAGAARLYGAAFARDPRLADDLDALHRYNAACAAALAGCGRGEDATGLGEEERARLRRQALDWLRADLAPYTGLAGGPAEVRAFVQKTMRHWLQDADLAGVRGKALAELPETERRTWARLWADVEKTLTKAQGRSTPKTEK
jgi:serine/threonine protein kinase/Flp pilus assembly protein TadD